MNNYLNHDFKVLNTLNTIAIENENIKIEDNYHFFVLEEDNSILLKELETLYPYIKYKTFINKNNFYNDAHGDFIYSAINKNNKTYLLISKYDKAFGVQTYFALYYLIFAFFAVLLLLIIRDRVFKTFIEPLDFLQNKIRKFSVNNRNDIILNNYIYEELINSINGFKNFALDSLDKKSTINNNQKFLLNSMENGVIAVDLEEKILLYNNSAKDLLESDKINKGAFIYKIIDDSDFINYYSSYNNRESIKDLQYEKNSNKKTLCVKINKLLNNKEEIIGKIILIQDVTNIRKLENMRKDFTSNVSHEFKTPLTSIIGFVETLEDGALEDKAIAKKFLGIIKIEAYRLKRLIGEVLYISEIEHRAEKIQEDKNLSEILNHVVNILNQKALDKNIIIEVNIDDKIYFPCESDAFSQIFINIIDNSIKYTKEGKISISLKLENKCIEFKVKDTGIGIDDKYIDRIFERFYKVDKSRQGVNSTGLGLSITKHLVNRYNGEIFVESEKNKGSTFVIKFNI
ncbi:MAG: sensor histidine kinase [Lachnospirales bacterium]